MDFPYLSISFKVTNVCIAINEYYVCIETDDDIQMMDNIDKAKLYDSGETQIIPTFNGNINEYKTQLLIRLKKYDSSI